MIPFKITKDSEYLSAVNNLQEFDVLVDESLGWYPNTYFKTIKFRNRLNDKDTFVIGMLLPVSNNHYKALTIQDSSSMFNDVQNSKYSLPIHIKLNSIAKEGYFGGGYTPFGYSKKPVKNTNTKHNILVINSIEAAIVKKIFNLAIADNKSLGGIARALNAQKLLRRGRVWDYKSVSRIVKNSIYHGERTWGKKRMEHFKNVPLITIKTRPIISKKQFLVARKKLQFHKLHLKGKGYEN
jgi:hypothetical protein